MSETFADTFHLLALFNPDDASHAKAVKAAKDFQGVLVTTDWILTEFADALSDPANRAECIRMVDDLRRSSSVIIVPASRELFETGWVLYRERPDKGWSLTDCMSFVVMKQRNIRKALTGDRHFKQAGFEALLK